MDYEVYDCLELEAEDSAVERGADGSVTGWRLLKHGRNELFKGGRKYVLELTPEMLEGAAVLQAEKGEKLPIDSRHALYWAAKKANIEERDALRQVPQGVAALGFGSLAVRGGDLWLTDVEWSPLAVEMMNGRMLRYFSPVLRGLDGRSPFRVTSVAMDNVPALSGLPVLAACQEGHQQEEKTMKKVEESLGRLLGIDVALGGEGDDEIAAKLDGLSAEIAQMKEKLEEAEATIAELKAGKEEAEKKAADAEAKAEELELSAENGRKTALLDGALAAGRITNAQVEALKKMDSVALGEFLAATDGQAVPGKGPSPKKDGNEDEMALSDAEKEMAERMGVSEEEMLKSKKAIAQ